MALTQRKLFYAKDKSGTIALIDRLKPGLLDNKFFCPHCSEEVIPKMGDFNVWHFAHKGRVCDALIEKKPQIEEKYEKKLFDYTDKFTTVIDSKFGPSKKFICKLCKKTYYKDDGIKWDESFFICKNCYLGMDKSDMEF